MQDGLLSNPLDFRMGINLGDVIDDGEDIHGEGVNIAARIEALAAPGSISISGGVYDQVRNRLDCQFEDMGEHEVKHVSAPVRVYRVGTGATAPKVEAEATEELVPHDNPSIAVLPFNNMSSDPEHEYFADGMAEDVITALSKISRMRVIARNSTFAYKGQALDLRRIAGELGVRYILEGSIRSGGNRLRITAQLIDANDGSHIWAERFDRTIDDIFDIQDEITKEIVTALRVKLTDGEEARMLARGTNDIEAWQLCVRAYDLFLRFNSTDFMEARALAEKAIERDPNYAFAWAALGLTFWFDGRLGYRSDQEANLARAQECAERATALDDTATSVIALNAHLAGITGRVQAGVDIARRGVELYPGNADVRAYLGFALIRAGAYRESMNCYRAAMSLNPSYPNWYRNSLARVLMVLGEFDEALAFIERSLHIEPANLTSLISKAYIFGQIERLRDAEEVVNEVTLIAPNLRLKHVPGILMFDEVAIAQRIVDGLREVGFPE
jgi:adenylate cyclase